MKDYYDDQYDDEYNLDNFLNEISFIKDAFQEYEKDREEYNEDEEYYRVPSGKFGYNL